MAILELSTLADYLDEDEFARLREVLAEDGAAPLDIDETADPVLLDANIDDDIFVDFTDRLDANDAAADIYLPTDFEEVFEVGGYKFGSAHALILALENLREDFFVDDDEDEEDDREFEENLDRDDEEFESIDDEGDDEPGYFAEGEGPSEVKDDHLRHIWRTLHRGAKAGIQRGLCLLLRTE